jgi:uncharacterized membrane protein
MDFWIFMLVMDLLIPCVMIGFGILFKHRPPKNINYIVGYRTARSMKSKETWDFAHRYSGRIWVICGSILLPISAAVMLLALGKDEDTVGLFGLVVCMIQVLIMILSIIPTEIALKKNFDENGKPVNPESRSD